MNHLSRWSNLSWLILCSLLLVGCGGGGGSSDAPPDTTAAPAAEGELVIAVTDAPGDFVTYVVDVQAMTLTRANGDVVEALPLTTRIDFAELTEVTEFLSVATVPAGVYTSASLRLDFSNAEILVQDEDGEALPADALDAEGNAITQIDVDLQLGDNDVITIRPGTPAAFSLDFDLDASNTIDLTGPTPVVVVEPFLLATPELELDRSHRVRGLLAEVDTQGMNFDLTVRPFRLRTGEFGQLNVNVEADSHYEINGDGLTGDAGLEALAALDPRTPVVVIGQIESDQGQREFVAQTVLAGSSVPWADDNLVRGVVVARTDDTLTVRGAYVTFADGTQGFRGEFIVQLTADTVVSAPQAGSPELTTASVSVGQKILSWGTLLDDQTLAAERVRLPLSQLTGVVSSVDPLAVDLFWLNQRRPALYDFSGTGISPADDADPDNYEIDTGLLPLQSLTDNDLIRLRGLVSEFGLAPPDFQARTLIDLSNDARAAQLRVSWPDGTDVPFISVTDERIDLDLSEARQSLKLRGVPLGAFDAAEQLGLVAPASGLGVYGIRVAGEAGVRVFRRFDEWVAQVTEQLDSGRLLYRVHAQGRYRFSEETLTTPRAGFVFIEPSSAL